MDERDFMRRAIELSAGSTPETGDQPFGCVVVKDGRIVGEGRNRVSSSLDPSAHGDIDGWIGFHDTERPPSTLDGKTPALPALPLKINCLFFYKGPRIV